MVSQKFEEILENFRSCVSDPGETYQNIKEETGKELIGYTLGDVPRELIHAAGFIPVGLVGSPEMIGDAASYLPSFCCSLMRSTLDMGLSGAVKCLSGSVVGHICDTTRDFSAIWQHHMDMPFFHDWMPPKQMKRPSAGTYILSELDRLKKHLEGFIGHEISESELESSFALYDTQRRLLGLMKEGLASGQGSLDASDFFTVLKAALFMDPGSFNRKAEGLLDELETFPKREVDSKVPLILSGKIPEPLAVISILEDAGARVVDDDFLWGSRLIRQNLPSEGLPLDRMARRFLDSEPFPGYLYEAPLRKDFLFRLADSSKARGVIFWNIKFCEPYNFDYPDLKKAFKERGIPTFMIETELQASGMEQLGTRLEAFIEAI